MLSTLAARAQPVAWVAHKDGRVDDIDSAPVLAEALPAKVSNKLTGPADKGRGGSGFFGKVQLHLQTALNNNRNNSLQAFQLFVLARYVLGVPKPY